MAINDDTVSQPDPSRLRLGEQMDGCRITIKAAMQDVLRLSVELTQQGVRGHAAPMKTTHGHLVDALSSLESAFIEAAHELAAKLDETLPIYPSLTGEGEA